MSSNLKDQNQKDSLWWFQKISLTDGLSITRRPDISLTPATIAILDLGGFKTKNDQIPFVPKDYWKDITNGSTEIYGGDYAHADLTAQFAAAINDGQKINGVASAGANIFKILPIKVQSSDPLKLIGDNTKNFFGGSQFNYAAGLVYAHSLADKINLQVVNLSITYPNFTKIALALSLLSPNLFYVYKPHMAVVDAINLLNKKNIIVVAGAGNDNKNACDNVPSSLPGVIAVGGTRYKSKIEKRYYFNSEIGSNYSTNEKCITVAAPAQDLLAYIDDELSIVSGTSFSAPMVSGLVALIKSIKPDLTYEEVVSLLRNNADNVVFGSDDLEMKGQTWKRINAYKTVQGALDYPCRRIYSPAITKGISGDYILYYLTTGTIAYYDLKSADYYTVPETASYHSESLAKISSNKISFICDINGELKACLYDILTKKTIAQHSLSQPQFGAGSYFYNNKYAYIGYSTQQKRNLIKILDLTNGNNTEIDFPPVTGLGPFRFISGYADTKIILPQTSTTEDKLYYYDGKWNEVPSYDRLKQGDIVSVSNSGMLLIGNALNFYSFSSGFTSLVDGNFRFAHLSYENAAVVDTIPNGFLKLIDVNSKNIKYTISLQKFQRYTPPVVYPFDGNRVLFKFSGDPYDFVCNFQ